LYRTIVTASTHINTMHLLTLLASSSFMCYGMPKRCQQNLSHGMTVRKVSNCRSDLQGHSRSLV